MPNLNTVLTNSSGISLNIQQAEDRLFKEVTDGTRRPYMIPTITSVQNRYNVWAYQWTNGEPWTNYYNYLTGAGEPDCERAFWFSLGTNTRQSTLSYSGTDLGSSYGDIQYATNTVVGGEALHGTWNISGSYGPMRFRTIFLRNYHPTLTKSVTMYGHYSNYWSAGYEGSGVTVGTPNAQNYASTTRVNWTVPANRSSGNSYYTWSWNVSIPPLRTVAVVQANSMYLKHSGNEYKWADINKFYDLHTTFSDFWVQPDLKMTQAANTYNDHDNQFNTYTAHKIWNRTSELFGDR